MYYLWYGDDSGRLLLSRVISAAERGVKVRFIVDDMLLIGIDKTLVALERHPNIQFRVFNPWRNRKLGMGIEFVGRMSELNSRMHNKLLIADNRAIIAGGRNIGDHYFGLHRKYNFHDLDVLGVGPISRAASDFFDSFWNSAWVVSAAALPARHDPEFAARQLHSLLEQVREAESLSGFEVDPRSWDAALRELVADLHPGAATMVFDAVDQDALIQQMPELLTDQFARAREEILLVNAYIIPGQPFIDGIRQLKEQGVSIRMLTNSLSSNDVPAVNSHYKRWREPIISAGADLYEFRSDPAIKPRIDTAPVVSGFSGLHTKAFVVDRQSVFIGSMNFDPRSVNINTEMGLTIDSPGLARDLAGLAERDMGPDNAWRVTLGESGRLTWTNAERTVTRQPAQNAWQRFMDALFRLLPVSQL
jgi:putative cardiolipin synthase